MAPDFALFLFFCGFPGFLGGVSSFLGVFRFFLGVFLVFLGCSGFFGCSGMFRDVLVFRCSVFRYSWKYYMPKVTIPKKAYFYAKSQVNNAVDLSYFMQSRLGELGLQSIDVGAGAGDWFFRSVSHQLYGNSNVPSYAYTYCWGSIYERQPREIY